VVRLLFGPRELKSGKLYQNVPSITRVAAGASGFLTLIQVLDGLGKAILDTADSRETVTKIGTVTQCFGGPYFPDKTEVRGAVTDCPLYPVLLFRGYSVGAVADTGTMSPDRSSLT
jgi:hypothetical protein